MMEKEKTVHITYLYPIRLVGTFTPKMGCEV